MDKINVALDSCVFFFSLGLFDTYKNQGEEVFYAHLAELENNINDIKKQLVALVGSKYYDKHKNEPFEKMLDGYKASINSMINNANRMIVAYTNLINGFTNDENGNKVPVNLPPAAIAQKKQRIEELNDQIIILENISKSYLTMRNDYKMLNQQLFAGKIIDKYIKGEIRLHIVEDAYREILNHIGDEKQEVNFKTFSQNVVNQLLSECVLVSIREKGVMDIVEALSSEYRKSHLSDGSRMKDDINSLGVYGDSRIMAEANLAGLILLTFNKKDFIHNKAGEYDNSQIRENIDLVNKVFDLVTTDALPYTPEEFIGGKYKLPEKQSEQLKISPINQHEQTKGVIELCN